MALMPGSFTFAVGSVAWTVFHGLSYRDGDLPGTPETIERHVRHWWDKLENNGNLSLRRNSLIACGTVQRGDTTGRLHAHSLILASRKQFEMEFRLLPHCFSGSKAAKAWGLGWVDSSWITDRAGVVGYVLGNKNFSHENGLRWEVEKQARNERLFFSAAALDLVRHLFARNSVNFAQDDVGK